MDILDYAYNPIGKMLIRISEPQSLGYIQSMCDLEGMQRIVALEIALRTQHISDESVAS